MKTTINFLPPSFLSIEKRHKSIFPINSEYESMEMKKQWSNRMVQFSHALKFHSMTESRISLVRAFRWSSIYNENKVSIIHVFQGRVLLTRSISRKKVEVCIFLYFSSMFTRQFRSWEAAIFLHALSSGLLVNLPPRLNTFFLSSLLFPFIVIKNTSYDAADIFFLPSFFAEAVKTN